MDADNKLETCSEKRHDGDSHIRYWIMEVQFSDTALSIFLRLCEEAGLTMDEYFNRILQYACDHPEELRRLKDEAEKDPPDNSSSEIEVIRIYPVYVGETESEARERAVREEEAD